MIGLRTPTAPTAIAGRGGTSRSRVPSPFGTVPSGYKLSAQVPPMPAAAEKKALSFEAGAPASQWTAAFHLAFPVRDVEESRAFYGSVLGLPEGRSSARWIDFNLYGHQIVCHQVDGYKASGSQNAVDGDPVPVPHFGLAMSIEHFHDLATRVRNAGIPFVIEPHLRFEGMPGEQWTMFFKDPSGNALEFKAMTTPENLFAKYHVD